MIKINYKFLIRLVVFFCVWGGKFVFILGFLVLILLMFFFGFVGYCNCFSLVYDVDLRKCLENVILVLYIVWKIFLVCL